MEGKAEKQQKVRNILAILCPPSWKNDWNNVVDIDDIRDQRHK